MVLKGKGPGEGRLFVELHSVQNSPGLVLSLMMVVKVYQVLLVTQALEILAIPRQTWISYKRKQKRKTNPKNMDEL